MATNTTDMPTAPRTGNGRTGAENETAASLLRRLVDDLSRLLRQELALATSEVSRSISDAKTGVGSIASGGAVLFAGFLVLLISAVLGLSNVVEPWLAALIVGGVVALVGFIMLSAGRSKLRAANFRADRTREQLHKDVEMMQARRST